MKDGAEDSFGRDGLRIEMGIEMAERKGKLFKTRSDNVLGKVLWEGEIKMGMDPVFKPAKLLYRGALKLISPDSSIENKCIDLEAVSLTGN